MTARVAIPRGMTMRGKAPRRSAAFLFVRPLKDAEIWWLLPGDTLSPRFTIRGKVLLRPLTCGLGGK